VHFGLPNVRCSRYSRAGGGDEMASRLLAVADIHSRAAAIQTICKAVNRHAPDAIIVAGDLTNYGDAAEVQRVLDSLPGRVLAIPGNLDVPRAFQAGIAKSHAESLMGQCIEIHGVGIVGLPNRGVTQATPCDVLVVHEPPFGLLDDVGGGRHIGFREHLDALRSLRPKVLLCGHCHEAPGVLTHEGTIVVNCTLGSGSRGALVECDGNHAKAWLV
jgi:Icc-related predicted phosphoesterase